MAAVIRLWLSEEGRSCGFSRAIVHVQCMQGMLCRAAVDDDTATLPHWGVTREEQVWGDAGGMRGSGSRPMSASPSRDWGLAVRAMAPVARVEGFASFG